jgi:hypothetical protein
MPPVTLAEVLIILGLVAWTVHDFLKVIRGPNGSKGFDNILVNFFSSAVGVAGKIVVAVESQLEPLGQIFAASFQAGGPAIAKDLAGPLGDLAKNEFTGVEGNLAAIGESTPDNAVATAADAIKSAFGFGMSSAAVAALFEATFPEKLNVLNGVGPMLAKMAGFDEVVEQIRDPLYANAFGKSAEYHYRSIFKPDLPSEFDAVRWHSQRLLTDDQLRVVFKYSGLKAEYEAPFVASAYRAIQPRAIATAVQDSPFPRDQMQSMLEFYGARPQDVALLLDLFEVQSTRNVRNQYLSATITAAERGTLTPAEVDSNLTDLNFSDQAKHWVQLTIATRKLEQLAELYRKSVSEAYKYSLISDADYVSSLEAIGIAAADANAHYAVDSEAKLGKEAAAAARAAARLAAETTRAASKAALENYAAHNIDEIALAAALAVAGLPVQVIPYAVDVAALRRQASQRNVFGKLVNPRDAILLREQVAALKEQVIKKLLDTTSARAQLQGLGLPNVNIEDLLAAWAAQALKTVLPVQ